MDRYNPLIIEDYNGRYYSISLDTGSRVDSNYYKKFSSGEWKILIVDNVQSNSFINVFQAMAEYNKNLSTPLARVFYVVRNHTAFFYVRLRYEDFFYDAFIEFIEVWNMRIIGKQVRECSPSVQGV